MTKYELLKYCAEENILARYIQETYACLNGNCNVCKHLKHCMDLYQDDSPQFTIEEVNQLKEECPELFL